jgi:hypothetical protein
MSSHLTVDLDELQPADATIGPFRPITVDHIEVHDDGVNVFSTADPTGEQ